MGCCWADSRSWHRCIPAFSTVGHSRRRRCRAGTELVFYLPTGKAFSATGTVREPRDLGFDVTCHSRGLLEYCVRQCALAHTNIAFASESAVQGLVYADGRVRGVRYHQGWRGRSLAADFVVDAGGRRSQAPRWLTDLGFRAPEKTTIGVDIAYASTKFRVPAEYDEPERLLGFFGPPPDFPNGAIMEVIEDQTWHVTLVGRFGAYPPPTQRVFWPLPSPCISQVVPSHQGRRAGEQTLPSIGFPRVCGAITND